MHPKIGTAIAGGFAGTVAMTVMMYFVAPMMLGKPMDVAGASLIGHAVYGALLGVIAGPAEGTSVPTRLRTAA